MIAVQDLACYFTGTGVQSSFCAESVEALDLTERSKAGLLSRAPVKSSDVSVTLWHFLTPIFEPGPPGSFAPPAAVQPVGSGMDTSAAASHIATRCRSVPHSAAPRHAWIDCIAPHAHTHNQTPASMNLHSSSRGKRLSIRQNPRCGSIPPFQPPKRACSCSIDEPAPKKSHSWPGHRRRHAVARRRQHPRQRHRLRLPEVAPNHNTPNSKEPICPPPSNN